MPALIIIVIAWAVGEWWYYEAENRSYNGGE
jgi:hypothetical protein